MNYYNEWDPYRAEWLRNLIRDGLIPDGKVDERGIEEVKAEDLEGFTQCHFFAGIGGWCEALRIANWLPDVPAWTGSCPCQPLSCAGKREGEKDSRHLWPVFYRLICERRPPVVFGEQTASGDGHEWVAGVRLDLEAAGYRVGIADLPAACSSAPHPRQRLWWVADAAHENGWADGCRPTTGARGGWAESAGIGSSARGLGDTKRKRLERHSRDGYRGEKPGRLDKTEDRPTSATGICADGMANSSSIGRGQESANAGRRDTRDEKEGHGSGHRTSGFWSDFEVLWRNEPKRGLVPCRAEPGIFPLVAGVPTRVEQVGAYGDAIVPQCAAEFVKAFMDCR